MVIIQSHGWLVVLGLTALWDNIADISGRLSESMRKKMIDERKKCPNNPHPYPLKAQQTLALL